MRVLIAAAFLAAAVIPVAAQSGDEIALYQLVRESTNPDELRVYLKSYPDGAFAELVKTRLARVEEAIAAAKKKKDEAAAKAAADAAAAEKAKAAEATKGQEDKAVAEMMAAGAAPTTDEIKAMLNGAYFTAANYHLPEGGTLTPIWNAVKVGEQEMSTLYSTDYNEYLRRGSDLAIARWPVEIAVDAEINEGGKKRVEPSVRRLYMYRTAAGAWTWNWRP